MGRGRVLLLVLLVLLLLVVLPLGPQPQGQEQGGQGPALHRAVLAARYDEGVVWAQSPPGEAAGPYSLGVPPQHRHAPPTLQCRGYASVTPRSAVRPSFVLCIGGQALPKAPQSAGVVLRTCDHVPPVWTDIHSQHRVGVTVQSQAGKVVQAEYPHLWGVGGHHNGPGVWGHVLVRAAAPAPSGVLGLLLVPFLLLTLIAGFRGPEGDVLHCHNLVVVANQLTARC
mmetsp:Transcript_12867/g.18990  ORF Transcript_12867/g.18990 Transcript_12867/m.18990 type:complete len:226 (+) Transcript_12867:1620-2297(+)